MKLQIKKSDFVRLLQRIQGIVATRNTMPILANVLLDCSKTRLTAIATDLEVFIKDSIEADISEEGAITINAKKLFDMIKELPMETISVASHDDKVLIKSGKSRVNLLGLPAKDFPPFPTIDETKLSAFDKDILKEMIDKTAFAVSTDETRYNINGFLLEKDDKGMLRMVATDGHRLALVEKKDSTAFLGDEKKGVLLPKKGVNEIRRLLDEEGEFNIHVTQKNATIKKDAAMINTRLLEGEFPDYKKVIPKDNDKEIIVNRDSLLSSLKRVSIISSDKIRGVKFAFKKNVLTISSSSQELGDATDEVDIDYNGEDIEIAFNARYFIDALEAITEENARIKLKDQLSPGIIRPAIADGDVYVVMPMRI
ncbi:MAG: DNA polymerase III subunit beta [Deltaproteobacteria bacterium]|nr:DNA polymerase III subunit beta [Deltaproteobacteria bacterium]